tara:strand:- start:2263 stop:2982 length:720 start_codon:yes stop_codon:yes gene_type:complete
MLADEHAGESGLLKHINLQTLDTMIGVDGLAEAMAFVGWLEETEDGVQFVDYQEHNGSTAKTRALAQKRQSRKRHAPVTVERDNTVTRIDKNRIDKNNHIQQETPAGDVGVCVKICEEVAKAYGSPPSRISNEAKRSLWENHKTQNFTEEDLTLCCRFIKKHRSGKFGNNAPRIAQSASKAVEGFSDLLARAEAHKETLEPLKRTPIPKDDRVEPTDEEMTDYLNQIKEFKQKIKSQQN